MTSAFDLSAYLERIGYQDEPSPDLATLASIVLGHAQSIAFENLDPFLGRPVALDPASLQAKLVAGGRGGYCFEHNLLLAHALRAAGFRTTGLAARVLWKRPRGEPPPRTHMLLRVDVDEGAHLVDVGFGGLTLTGILRLDADVAQTTPHERFRLLAVEDELVMQAEVAGGWQDLYRFSLSQAFQSDYEMASWYLSNHPASHFVTGLMAARADEHGRHALRGNELSFHRLGGGTERRTLASPAELQRVLETDFQLNLTGLGEIQPALARLWSSPRP